MEGTVSSFSIVDSSGIIADDSGKKYQFSGSRWPTDDILPSKNLRVRFTVDPNNGKQAIEISILQPRLSDDVNKQFLEFKRLKNLNQSLGISLGLLGISVSLTATVFGIVQLPRWAAGFAAAGASVQAILFAFPVDKRASFYRVLLAKNRVLDLNLKYNDIDEKEAKDDLNNLGIIAANEEPQGDINEAITLKRIEGSIKSLDSTLGEYRKLLEGVKVQPDDPEPDLPGGG